MHRVEDRLQALAIARPPLEQLGLLVAEAAGHGLPGDLLGPLPVPPVRLGRVGLAKGMARYRPQLRLWRTGLLLLRLGRRQMSVLGVAPSELKANRTAR